MKAFLAAGLLLCLVATCVFADDTRRCLKYRIETFKNIRVGNSTHNLLRINMNILLRPSKGPGNMWTMDMRDPEVFIDREKTSRTIDLNRCPSNVIAPTRATLPTLVVLDNNGLLQEIRVDNSESEVAINAKLYIASLLQVNLKALQETKKEMTAGKELMYIGECPVTYEVKRDMDKKGANMRVIKRYNLSQCDNLRGNRPVKSHKHVPVMEEGIQVTGGISDITLRQEKESTILNNILFNASFNYNSAHNSGKRTHIDATIRMTLKEMITCDAAVPAFVNTNARVINREVLRPVDEQLIHGSAEDDKSDLREIYRGLSNGGAVTNIYQDVYERALRCWELLA